MAAQLNMRMWSIILDTFTMDGCSIKHEDVVYYSRPPSPWMAAQLNMRMWSIILDTFTMDGCSIKHEDVVYYSRHLHHGWPLN